MSAPYLLTFGPHLRGPGSPTELPFYKKHPKFTGAALGITGGLLLAPVAAVGLLTALGFTSAGVAAGNSILFPPKELRY